ncbi:MAG: hypothetical protein HYZ47_00260 [Simkania negevensis]|nr:hypothetical protein [Simkania negevensis]
MKKYFLFCLFLLPSFLFTQDPLPFFCYFEQPPGWILVKDPSPFPSTQIGFVESKRSHFTSSISLTVKKTSYNLKEYIEKAKAFFQKDAERKWREVGPMQTKSGEAILSQIDIEKGWGSFRELQCTTVQGGYVFVLSGVSVKSRTGGEHLKYYDIFLNAFRSFHITPDLFSSVTNNQKKRALEMQIQSLQQAFSKKPKNQELPLSKEPLWNLLEKFLFTQFEQEGKCWQIMALKKIQEILTTG